jgi:NADH dehydrogenase
LVGLSEHAFPLKTLADAIHLRNHVLHVLEEAAIEQNPALKKQLLTFVIAGGGFSGVEVAAELNDFVRRAARHYRNVDASGLRVILLHSGERILDREISEELSLYAQRLLRKRGLEIRLKSRLRSASSDAALLQDGERIPTRTLVSTVPSSPHPIIEALDLPKDKGRVKATLTLQVENQEGLWALGDCAVIPNPDGKGFCPPTAQYATRQAKVAAGNIVASMRGREKKVFDFRGLGKMGSLGYRSAVAEILGGIKLSGFPAWFLWRTLYLLKLPGLERKVKVAIAWALDLLIPPEMVQLKLTRMHGVSQAHYEAGEIVFRQGDLGDSLNILLSGEAEVECEENGSKRIIAHLRPGEYFGEMALLNRRTRIATIRCVKAMDVLALHHGDFHALAANLQDFRQGFEQTMARRITQTQRAGSRDA